MKRAENVLGKNLTDLLNHVSKLDKRQESFIIMLEHLMKSNSPYIVETGTTRSKDNYEGDGMSTVFWDLFCQIRMDAHYISLDINPLNCAVARSLVKYDECIICSDSIQYLNFNKPPKIDLLYLDSYDLDLQDAAPAFLHCFNEFVVCQDRLMDGALICVDDNIPAIDEYGNALNISKGHYLKQYLSKIGIEPIFEGYQLLWRFSK